ncbi:hypothetical protein GCM10008965_16710 [Methylorubrum aminovorans]
MLNASVTPMATASDLPLPMATATAAAWTSASILEALPAETVILPCPPSPFASGARSPFALIVADLVLAMRAWAPPRMVFKPSAPPPAKLKFFPPSVLISTAIAVAVALALISAPLLAITRTSPALAVTSPTSSIPASKVSSTMVLRAMLRATETLWAVCAGVWAPVCPPPD